MSPERQRIAIAKACGWTMIHQGNTMAMYGTWCGYPPRGQIIGRPDPIPDYDLSLDAIYAAMDFVVTGPDIHEYQSNEAGLDGFINAEAEAKEIPVWRLEPRDYCRALLKFLGKWEEES